MDSLRRTLRRLARTPGFSAVTVLTLALGIGANVVVFAILDNVLLEPLPYPEADRLVGVWHTAPGLGWDEINQAPALYFIYRERARTFQESGMWDRGRAVVTGLDRPERVETIGVTDGVLPLLGARPLHGRLFSGEDVRPDATDTVVLAYEYWRRRFAADPGIVGRTLRVDGKEREIIGVLEPSFRFLETSPELYLPLRFDRSQVYFGNFSYTGIARLRPGVTLEQANDELAGLIETAIEEFPPPPGFSVEMLRSARLGPLVRPLSVDVVGNVGEVLWVLFGMVGMVLLVACANVANLFLVRAEGRHQELAVRAALGADRWRLSRELLGESLFLGLLGGLVGIGLAEAGIRWLRLVQPRGLPRLSAIEIDGSVLLFTLCASLFAGLLFGLAPLLRLRLERLLPALKEGGRGGAVGRPRHRLRNLLVVAQVAAALVLLVGAGLMLRSFAALRAVDPGFYGADEVLTVRLSMASGEFPEPTEVVQLQRSIVQALAAIPGVQRVALANSLPMDGFRSNDPIFVEERPIPEGQLPPLRRFKWVSPGYFATMGIPLLAGRDLSWEDVERQARVAVINRALAAEYWDDPRAAVGKRIRQSPGDPWRTIVGVVGDALIDGVDQPPVPAVYWPLAQRDFWQPGMQVQRSVACVIRSGRVGSASLLEEVRSTIWAQNRNLPLADARTMSEIVERSLARTSFTLVTLAVAAATALLLGAIGVYGVISYVVAERTREIGVRMALGARGAEIRRMVLRHALLLSGLGVVTGGGVAAVATRTMASMLYGVGAFDPLTYTAVAAALVAAALVASWLPARRATRVAPAEALRWQ